MISFFYAKAEGRHPLTPDFQDPLYKDASGWTLTQFRTTVPFADLYAGALEKIIDRLGYDPKKAHRSMARIYYGGYENYWVCAFTPNNTITKWRADSQIILKYISFDDDTLVGKSTGWFFSNADQFTQKERQVISSEDVKIYFEMPNSYFDIMRIPRQDNSYMFFFKMRGLDNAKEIVKGSCSVINVRSTKGGAK